MLIAIIQITENINNNSAININNNTCRQINEQLYTTPSSDAVALFKEEPALFGDFHQGFRTQVSKWPMNPLDVCVSWLNKKLVIFFSVNVSD